MGGWGLGGACVHIKVQSSASKVLKVYKTDMTQVCWGDYTDNYTLSRKIMKKNREEENREDSSVVGRRRLKPTIDACSRRQMGSAYNVHLKVCGSLIKVNRAYTFSYASVYGLLLVTVLLGLSEPCCTGIVCTLDRFS